MTDQQQPGWLKGQLIDTLARIANQKTVTQPPARTADPAKVIEFQSLDKLDKAIRGLQGQIVQIDGEEHRLALEAQAAVNAYTAKFSDIGDRRGRLYADLRTLQLQLVEAVKRAGIMAHIIEPKDSQYHGKTTSREHRAEEAWAKEARPGATANSPAPANGQEVGEAEAPSSRTFGNR